MVYHRTLIFELVAAGNISRSEKHIDNDMNVRCFGCGTEYKILKFHAVCRRSSLERHRHAVYQHGTMWCDNSPAYLTDSIQSLTLDPAGLNRRHHARWRYLEICL